MWALDPRSAVKQERRNCRPLAPITTSTPEPMESRTAKGVAGSVVPRGPRRALVSATGVAIGIRKELSGPKGFEPGDSRPRTECLTCDLERRRPSTPHTGRRCGTLPTAPKCATAVLVWS